MVFRLCCLLFIFGLASCKKEGPENSSIETVKSTPEAAAESVRYYEVEYPFLGALTEMWLKNNFYNTNTDENALSPRVNPRAALSEIGIEIDTGETFRHLSLLGRQILVVAVSAEEHGKLKKAYREIMKKEIPVLKPEDFYDLFERNQDEEIRNQDPNDPFSTGIEERTRRSTTNPTALVGRRLDWRRERGRSIESALSRSDWVC